MEKELLLAVLLIMKRIRIKWEDNVYNTWSYNFSYSTRWMGIDKKSPVTELKRVSLDLKKFTENKAGEPENEQKASKCTQFKTKQFIITILKRSS